MKISKGVLVVIALTPLTTLAADKKIQNHQICKAGIATVMGKEPNIITATNISSPIIGLSYIRKDDGTKWLYKCKINGNTIVWGSSDGRWREDPLDSVITYKISGDSIIVSEKYTDGSESVKEYKHSSLGK